jgi:chromosomal replication initiator protein
MTLREPIAKDAHGVWFWFVDERVPTIREIQHAVCKHYNISLCDLLSQRRTRSLVRPRHVAFYLACTLTKHSTAVIGHFFGDRDHSTVLHARNTIAALKATDARLAADIAMLERGLT